VEVRLHTIVASSLVRVVSCLEGKSSRVVLHMRRLGWCEEWGTGGEGLWRSVLTGSAVVVTVL